MIIYLWGIKFTYLIKQAISSDLFPKILHLDNSTKFSSVLTLSIIWKCYKIFRLIKDLLISDSKYSPDLHSGRISSILFPSEALWDSKYKGCCINSHIEGLKACSSCIQEYIKCTTFHASFLLKKDSSIHLLKSPDLINLWCHENKFWGVINFKVSIPIILTSSSFWSWSKSWALLVSYTSFSWSTNPKNFIWLFRTTIFYKTIN